jgi:hypothetical protein
MARSLLIRGMSVGVIAALLVMLFARVIAEPQVDLAIAFEARQEAHAASLAPDHIMAADEPEIVSRGTQKGLGLLTALGLYGAAMGGIFSLVFAASYGRLGTAIGPRTLSLLLASGAFLAIALVPALKYPPTPPAVGLHETVAFRTLVYFAMIALSLASLVMAIRTGRGLAARIGVFNAVLAAAGLYVLAMIVVQLTLPVVDEVPADFPATVLWQFRIASLGMQAILWSVIGIGFGALAETLLRAQQSRRG